MLFFRSKYHADGKLADISQQPKKYAAFFRGITEFPVNLKILKASYVFDRVLAYI
jgi:hypothetical protein